MAAANKRKKSASSKKRTATPAAPAPGRTPRSEGPSTRSVAELAEGMTPAQRVVWYCLHGLVLLVPLAISNWTFLPGVDLPFTFDQFDIVKVVTMRGITLVAFAAWAWHVFVEGGSVRRTKVDYLILAVLGWVALSVVFSIHPPTAIFGKYRRFEGLISFINYAAMYFLVVQLIDRVSRIRALARTLFYSGTAVSFYGVLQYLGADPFSWGRLPFEDNRAFSTYGNPDLLGGFIVFPLVISLGLALSERDSRWRAVFWSGFLLTVVCWITAFTRGAWIGGAVGLIVLGLAAWRLRPRLTRVDLSFAGAIAGVSAAVVIRSLTADHQVLNVWRRLVSIFEFDSGSALTRFQIWDAAWRATLDRPVFGFGADTFRLVFPQYKPIEYVQTAGHISVADNVHNYILQLTSAIGIPGMLLLYGLFFTVAALSARRVLARPEPAENASPRSAAAAAESTAGRLIVAAFWAACAAYVVHLTFALSVTGSTFLLWISMGVLMAPGARIVEFTPPSWGRIAAGGVIALCAVAFIGNAVYIAADHAYLRARLGGASAERINNAQTAVRLNPYNDMYRAEVGVAHADVFTQLSEQMAGRGDSGEPVSSELRVQTEQYFRLAESSFLETIEFVEYEFDNYVFLTGLYNRAGQIVDPVYLESAKQTARRGIALSEFGPALRLQYALAHIATGDLVEAQAQLELAVEADPRYAEGNMLLGDVILRQGGDAAAALAYLETAKQRRADLPGIDSLIESAQAELSSEE